MKLGSRILVILFYATITIVLLSCTRGPNVEEFPENANSGTELNSLSTDMILALKEQVDLLAPNSFKKAKESWEIAHIEFDRMEHPRSVLYHIAKARAYLKQANQFAYLALGNIENVLLARGAALKAGAKSLFTKNFKTADQKLKKMTSDLEENDLSNVVKNRTSLQNIYLELEFLAIRHTNLVTVKALVELAINEGASEFAPEILTSTLKSIDSLEAYIVAHRHDFPNILSRSKEATYLAENLLKVTRNLKKTDQLSLKQVSLKQKGGNRKLNLSQLDLEKLKITTPSLKKKKITYINQQKFKQQFEKTRLDFKNSEAEVYRLGNTLVIRLRGLTFPSTGSSLPESNFPLLAKVQNVVRDFSPSSILVEGHTDSVGTKNLSRQLSVIDP